MTYKEDWGFSHQQNAKFSNSPKATTGMVQADGMKIKGCEN